MTRQFTVRQTVRVTSALRTVASAVLVLFVLPIAGCGSQECPDVAAATQGISLSTNLWQAAHPDGHLTACLRGMCRDPGARLGQNVRNRGPYTLIVKLYDHKKSHPQTESIELTFT
jgi:hypothetical protein